MTLCYITKDNSILLGMKKRGFGAGWWNGFGGKVKSGEDIEKTAKREMLEEVGIEIVDFEKKAVLNFFNELWDYIPEVHIFNADGSNGGLCLNGLRCAAHYFCNFHCLIISRGEMLENILLQF